MLENNKKKFFLSFLIIIIIFSFDRISKLYILNLTETKSYGVIDFKTTKIDEKKADVYFYQLEAYALILENAEKKDYHLTPVTHLGLLMMQPDVITKHNKKYIFQNRRIRK